MSERVATFQGGRGGVCVMICIFRCMCMFIGTRGDGLGLLDV